MTADKLSVPFKRHDPLFTPLGRAYFDALGSNGTYYVYHIVKDFTPEEWVRRFGPKAGNMVFRFYLVDRCIAVDPATGGPVTPLPFVDDPLYPTETFKAIPKPPVSSTTVGDIWYTKRGGDPYKVVSVKPHEIVIAYIHDSGYKRIKPSMESLERGYTRDDPNQSA